MTPICVATNHHQLSVIHLTNGQTFNEDIHFKRKERIFLKWFRTEKERRKETSMEKQRTF